MKGISRIYENRKIQPQKLQLLRERIVATAGNDTDAWLNDASITQGNTTFDFGNSLDDEEEFLAKYSEVVSRAAATWYLHEKGINVSFRYEQYSNCSKTFISIKLPKKSEMLSLMSKFDEWYNDAAEEFKNEVVEKSAPTLPIVFLGHGRSPLWRDLRDHLQDMHGFKIEAYESGSRAGHSIRDIVEGMASTSDIAFLIHTAEDELSDGKMQGRPNVIHETGLFQGKLGFARALVLLEEGCEEFSNLAGIQQIRFSRGNIRETFGDVLAVLKREFG